MIRSQKLAMIDATLCSIEADAMRVVQDTSTDFRSALEYAQWMQIALTIGPMRAESALPCGVGECLTAFVFKI